MTDSLTDRLTDVNFRHSSQYCKVSLKLCTKNEHTDNLTIYRKHKSGSQECKTVVTLLRYSKILVQTEVRVM